MTFEAFLRDLGLRPREITGDGKWRRCPTEEHPRKTNGTYKLAEDGNVGWGQNWEVHAAPLMWRPEQTDKVAQIDYATIRQRQAHARQELLKATAAARNFYAECKPLRGGHPYLTAHNLNMAGCHGLKVDAKGWLVVPVLLDGALMSVQRIGPAGEKKFWPGASVKGASYTVKRNGASITVLCEGLATGLAIFAAARLTRIVVAFNAGNLPRVSVPRSGLAVVAADNDHETAARLGRNPGVLAAQEAAAGLGCGVAIPEGIAGTDWCDWRAEMAAKRIAERPNARSTEIRRGVDAEIASAMARNARFLRREAAA